MVNILSYRRADGSEVQVNQQELQTPKGREWLEQEMGNTSEEIQDLMEHPEDFDLS